MNKRIWIGIIGISLLCITGCGAKTKGLHCTKEDASMLDMKTAQSYTIQFKKDKMSYIETSSEIKVDGVYKKYTKELLESLEQQFATVKGKKGVSIKPKKTDTVVSITAKLDIKKIGKDAEKLITMVDTTLNETKTKKSLEDQGFTCKIVQ